ncbi:Replicative DNA helicase [Nymphon striatum]|nr:Replicative DNA helicase [Nymphon striatum]
MEKPAPVIGRKIDKSTLINLERGKIPPQAVDLEEVVLGAMMIDKKGVDEVIDILHPDVFYKEAHRYVYEAIFKLFETSEPVDLLTVSSQLKKDGRLESVGGDFYLIKLTQKVASSAHIEFHARIILQKYIQRSLIKISNEIIEEAIDDGTDVFDLLDAAESKLYDVTQGNLKRSAETALDLVIQAKKRIEEIAAARPGMGKTALTLSMARNIAVDSGKAVAFFSCEMSSVQLITRLISSETGLSSEKLRNRAKARRLASQHDIKIIIIDYLQLMTAGGTGKNGNREQEISTISRNLKALAKELNIPVIALSQLSRAVETRGGSKRPILSDLRESGAIEQDADIVSFIFRPEYYKIDEWDDEERSPTQGQAELIVAKHRNGGLENIRLKFIGNLGKFDNLDDFDSPFEFQSKMNDGDDNPFVTKGLPSADEAFGSSMNDGLPEDDNDVPF